MVRIWVGKQQVDNERITSREREDSGWMGCGEMTERVQMNKRMIETVTYSGSSKVFALWGQSRMRALYNTPYNTAKTGYAVRRTQPAA